MIEVARRTPNYLCPEKRTGAQVVLAPGPQEPDVFCCRAFPFEPAHHFHTVHQGQIIDIAVNPADLLVADGEGWAVHDRLIVDIGDEELPCGVRDSDEMGAIAGAHRG